MSLQSSIIANLASVQADMNYLAPMLERPRNYTFEPPPGVPRSNTVNVSPSRAHPRCPAGRRPRVARRQRLRAGQPSQRRARLLRRRGSAPRLLPRGRARGEAGDGRLPRPYLRPHHTTPRPGRAGPQRCAAPARAARAHRPHRPLGPAARARPSARRGRRVAEGPRAGDQPVAADQGAGAGFAARRVRRHHHRPCRPGAVGPGLSPSRRRDLLGEVQSRAPLVLRAAHAAPTRRCC